MAVVSKIPATAQYVSSQTYYARIHIGGKIIRQSLGTSVWTTAQLKLVDFLKDKRTPKVSTEKPRIAFKNAVELFKNRVQHDSSMKQSSKDYRLLCIQKIKLSWPILWDRRLDEITTEQCRDWSTNLKNEIAEKPFPCVHFVGTSRALVGLYSSNRLLIR